MPPDTRGRSGSVRGGIYYDTESEQKRRKKNEEMAQCT